ncbi:hypothetical protein E8E12_008925 [Didymella heteroderae]|uniref:Uncharacterized protein n=1 Tax=Didymella heteroderae TaxID=1769908 RepID=A0A9P4WS02_9PLEO|nr:hypothetical protein E8E12_008925 [Didymella heteroderae]
MRVSFTTFLLTLLPTVFSNTIPPQGIHHLQPRSVDVRAEWEKAWCKGGKFAQAMVKDEDAAAAYVTPVRSTWDGDLVHQFRTWGYREIANHRSELCDFGPNQHNLQRAFTELGIGIPSSVDGGPNHCFYVEHKYGPAVQRPPDGQWPDPNQQYYMVGSKRYRETEAYSTIGINPDAGAVYFLNRLSPANAARDNWNIPEVRKEWLPALASSSDHAWAFWNRANAGNLGDIKEIFSCSPNGLGVGYFLTQHKHKLGNKAVEKITVFRPDKGIMPYLLFWIEDAPMATRRLPPSKSRKPRARL